jgi:hypothetical protein
VGLSPRAKILLSIAGGGCLAVVAVGVVVALRFQPLARDYVVSALSERYRSGVELGDLKISVFPTVHAVGENLVLRFNNRKDLPPMVRVGRFTLDGNFVSFFRSPRRISRVRLEGLEIHMPPRSAGGSTQQPAQSTGAGGPAGSFILDEVIADSAVISTTPTDPAKDPLVFRISQLSLHSTTPGQPMIFQAHLENPKPHGLIETQGSFGPWNSAQPRETPVFGKYTFRNADLGVFRGIAGILSSDGEFRGPLDRLEVHGTADVPGFELDIADRPMPLHTEFDATVDGTNGNTVLHPVHARLGASKFDVSGSIARGAVEKGKEIALSAEARGARVEDVLRLVMKGSGTPMTGRLAFTANIVIPPGAGPFIDRLQLTGLFTLAGGAFTNADVQGKIAGLSHRAQGDPNNHDPNVTADFHGNFRVRDTRLSLPDLTFTLPGARVALAGTYGLRSGAIDLKGSAKMDATVSQMTTGFKSTLLRPLDRFFRKDGAGTEIPIRIGGTRGQPSFTFDLGPFKITKH